MFAWFLHFSFHVFVDCNFVIVLVHCVVALCIAYVLHVVVCSPFRVLVCFVLLQEAFCFHVICLHPVFYVCLDFCIPDVCKIASANLFWSFCSWNLFLQVWFCFCFFLFQLFHYFNALLPLIFPCSTCTEFVL